MDTSEETEGQDSDKVNQQAKTRPILIFNVGNPTDKRENVRKNITSEFEKSITDPTLIKKLEITFNNNLLIYPTSLEAKNALLLLSFITSKKYLDLNSTDSKLAAVLKGISYDELTSNDQLEWEKIGVIDIKPMINKKDGSQIKITKLIFEDEQKFKNVMNAGKLSIGFFEFKVEKFGANPKQCHKCKQFGHIAVRCQNNTKCSICSGEHEDDKCDDREHPKCANCGENHSAYSRMCKIFREYKQQKQEQLTRKENYLTSKANGGQNGNLFHRNYSEAVSSSNKNEVSELKVSINDMNGKLEKITGNLTKLDTFLDSWESKIDNMINKKVDEKLKSNNEKMFYFVLDSFKTISPATFENNPEQVVGAMTNLFNHHHKLGTVDSHVATQHLSKFKPPNSPNSGVKIVNGPGTNNQLVNKNSQQTSNINKPPNSFSLSAPKLSN